MLDIKFIRSNAAEVREAIERKNISCNLEDLFEMDDRRKHLLQEFESLKGEQNKANANIAAAQGEDKQEAIQEMKVVADKVKEVEEQLRKVEEEFELMMLGVPNILHKDVPIGKDEEENVVIEVVGDLPSFDFETKDHIDLMKKHDMVDIERGVKLGGARSYFLKNDGVLLEQAILQYAFQKMIKKGFTAMAVPNLVNTECLIGTGYFPGGEEDVYHLERDNKWMIATSEIPVSAYHYNEILKEEELPKTYVAMSPCYRREAGSYGKDTAGLYRVHQFNKVEQVVIHSADKDEADRWLKEILDNAREVLEDLKIPYRVLQLCTGDLALGKYNSLDLECYMPSRESYGETHSATSFLDFQARRLKMRYKTKDGEIKYCYTLNNTVIASPRILVALVENNQQEDGSIIVPKVLRPYLGKDIITS